MLHDEKLLRLAYSLLFALPGSPALHYGEELGMGDDLALSERLAVRTPMQWTPGKNAGFTDAGHPIRPLITGEYGYDRLNVQSEEHDHNSLLEDIRRLAWMRKECPEIGLGRWSIPDTSNAQVLALQYDYEGRRLLIVHNFSAGVQEVSVPVDTRPGSTVIDLIGGEEQKIRQPRISITLPGYGYKWLRFSHQTIGRSKTS
jgi:maltose alpha-D-glucosyltransferase/alpha-amylase